jgi:hypothetical protein
MAELKESASLRGIFAMSVYKEEGGSRRLSLRPLKSAI